MARELPARLNNGLLQPLEQPALIWMASRLPAWTTPDLLTGVGLLGSLIAAGAYLATTLQPACLWIASFGLVVNWFGDSLDGSVARLRKIERPRYGFFLDQNIDAFAQFIFAIGLGFSGLIRFDFVMVGLSLYLMLSMMAVIRALIHDIFAITHNGIGLTEWRVGFILLNTVIFFFPPQPLDWLQPMTLTYADIVAAVVIVSMIYDFISRMFDELRLLAAEEPTPR